MGKVRHVEVNQLWLQEKVTSGEIEVVKVPRAENRADALTHPIDAVAFRFDCAGP